jgi:Cu-Zn family superoxide dismutase
MKLSTDGRNAYRLGVLALAGLIGAASLALGGCAAIFGPHEKRADAQLRPTAGNTARGAVTFIERSDGVQVTYNFVGLPPNSDHALEIHERGDCNAADASSAGAIFSTPSERATGGMRRAGELGNLHADATGVATGFIVATDVSLDGVRSVVGRSVVVAHDARDAGLPGRSAAALGCGLIKQ